MFANEPSLNVLHIVGSRFAGKSAGHPRAAETPSAYKAANWSLALHLDLGKRQNSPPRSWPPEAGCRMEGSEDQHVL